MARRRTRRFKGTWLPNLGTITAGYVPYADAGRQLQIAVPADSRESIVAVTPVIFDDPIEGAAALSGELFKGLNALTGNEYAIRRIVGKCFASITPLQAEAAETTAQAVKVTAGFFVARAADDQEWIDQPIGGTATYVTSYNPAGLDSIREPWIWRRTWILQRNTIGTELEGASPLASLGGFPTTTAGYGSVADGPHIDAKTRRRIANDERLWFAVAARNYPVSSTVFGADVSVYVHLDYRVFGAMRRARQRGAF